MTKEYIEKLIAIVEELADKKTLDILLESNSLFDAKLGAKISYLDGFIRSLKEN